MRITKKKIVATVAATAVVALGGTAAFAYFTTTGGGTATATVATSQAVTVSGFVAPGLAPGATEPVAVIITNPALFPQHVNGVSFTIAASGTCDTSWFTANPTTTPATGVTIPAHVTLDGVGFLYGASITMSDLPTVNQDSCQGAALTLTYIVS